MQTSVIPRHQQKLITEDTIAIRKMRELRKYTRTHAGMLLDISAKQIEAIENGRVQLTESRIAAFCAAYKVTQAQYEGLRDGRLVSLVADKQEAPKLNIIEHKHLRRNYKKIVDHRVRAIVSLRHLAGLTQNEASFQCGYARCQFGQLENGRIELSDKRIRHVVSRLGFTPDDFKKECEGELTTFEMRENCGQVIRRLSKEQLQNIIPLLRSLDPSMQKK